MSKLWMVALSIGVVLAALGCSASESSADAPKDQVQQEQAASESDASNAVSVKAVQVQRQALQAWIYTQGTARSRQREFLTFIEQGVVSHVDETLRIGSAVKAGQLIANQAPQRFQANLQAARAALAQAQANLALAEVTQQRYENLTAQRSASKQELDEAVVQVQQAKAARDNARAELAQAQLSVEDSRLVSPIDGVLARLNIEKGRYFMPATLQTGSEQDALRTIAALVINPDLFEVRVDLPSYEFRRISPGAKAVIGSSPPSNGQDMDPLTHEQQIQGQVHAFSPSLDPDTRTFEVLVYTHSGQAGLQDGEFVAVWIAEPELEQTLAVPMEAVRFRNDQSFVFVVNEAGDKVAERRVELGQQSGDYRAVQQGLRQGEWVVTEGRAALQDGQAVRLLNSVDEGRP